MSHTCTARGWNPHRRGPEGFPGWTGAGGLWGEGWRKRREGGGERPGGGARGRPWELNLGLCG